MLNDGEISKGQTSRPLGWSRCGRGAQGAEDLGRSNTPHPSIHLYSVLPRACLTPLCPAAAAAAEATSATLETSVVQRDDISSSNDAAACGCRDEGWGRASSC